MKIFREGAPDVGCCADDGWTQIFVTVNYQNVIAEGERFQCEFLEGKEVIFLPSFLLV